MTDPQKDTALLRRLLLALVLVGEVGLVAELGLLEHTESFTQWIPLAVLAAAVPLTLLAAIRPHPGAVLLLRALGGAMILTGIAGVYLHYRGNVEFEIESNSALQGWVLFQRAMRGATPALAPGAMVQLGLTLLIALFRHPRGVPSFPSPKQAE